MEESKNELRQLAAKISAVINDLGALPKDGNNIHCSYKYISSEAITEHLRVLLIKHGLLILPEVIKAEERDCGKNTRTTVTMKFQIIDIATGFSIEKMFFGADQDMMGKSSGQATTECVKRFFFKTFMVISEDDPDPDRRINPNGSPVVTATQVPPPSQVTVGLPLPPPPPGMRK